MATASSRIEDAPLDDDFSESFNSDRDEIDELNLSQVDIFKSPALFNKNVPDEVLAGYDTPSAIPAAVRSRLVSPCLEIPASPLLERLGYGTGVAVYKLHRSPLLSGVKRSPWAVKKVMKSRRPSLQRSMEQRLQREAQILKKLDHPNIVKFKGTSRARDGNLCLTMENGEKSLQQMIESRDEQGQGPFGAGQVYQVALGLGRALDYLHNCHHLLHADLKSANVLVKGHFHSVKLCDFGVALELREDLGGLKDPNDIYIGSEPWKCKEALENATITDRADIFAYGLVLYEMLALTVPHLDLLADSADEEAFDAALGSRPPLPNIEYSEEYGPLMALFMVCTSQEPARRPSAKQVLEFLGHHRDKFPDEME